MDRTLKTLQPTNARQFVPFHRLAEMFKFVFNIPISEGSLVRVINRVAAKATPAYELIRERVKLQRLTVGMRPE